MCDDLPSIKSAALFSGLCPEDICVVLKCLQAETETYQKDAWLLRAGDHVQSIGLLLSGSALIVQEDFWGNRNIVARIGSGQLFAESFACSSETTANAGVIAESPCRVLYFNKKHLLTTCPACCSHHSRIIQNLVTELANKNYYLNEKVTHLSQRTTREKLLSYLSAEARRHRSSEFTLPYSRQQLADYLSVDRSGLSSELGKMRKEGILSFSKNHFVLLLAT